MAFLEGLESEIRGGSYREREVKFERGCPLLCVLCSFFWALACNRLSLVVFCSPGKTCLSTPAHPPCRSFCTGTDCRRSRHRPIGGQRGRKSLAQFLTERSRPIVAVYEHGHAALRTLVCSFFATDLTALHHRTDPVTGRPMPAGQIFAKRSGECMKDVKPEHGKVRVHARLRTHLHSLHPCATRHAVASTSSVHR